ncbi:hypothetical protein AN618_12120 [Fervidicola ferrireducens]|uniref:Uncharacterized protein n=1 Tax=Fervidicola ferrireducens TaxID=520764 RepID=A0A140L9U0_9FIRM|nr:hypothetical protein AN618_12120 [Fervidicola ferrireducens]
MIEVKVAGLIGPGIFLSYFLELTDKENLKALYCSRIFMYYNSLWD